MCLFFLMLRTEAQASVWLLISIGPVETTRVTVETTRGTVETTRATGHTVNM